MKIFETIKDLESEEFDDILLELFKIIESFFCRYFVLLLCRNLIAFELSSLSSVHRSNASRLRYLGRNLRNHLSASPSRLMCFYFILMVYMGSSLT